MSTPKRGSMTVEAAIFLPIYIMAVVSLIFLIKLTFTQSVLYSVAQEEVSEAEISSGYLFYLSCPVALKEAGIDPTDLNIYPGLNTAGLVNLEGAGKYDISLDTGISIPAPFTHDLTLKTSFIYREWTGRAAEGEAFGFERMEKDEYGNTVYVFPNAGGKYHKSGCRYVESHPVEVVLNAEIRKKYSPCPNCTEGDEPNGQKVYIFSYGSSYHESDCSAVNKYVITMDREDALEKGYTACSVCGG